MEWLAQQFQPEQIAQAYLVIAATNDNALNQQVFEQAEAQPRLVNVVDDQPHCSYIFPSVIDRSPLQIAISSSGAAPVLIRLLREKLDTLIPQNVGVMAEVSAKWRNAVKAKFRHLTQHRRFWEQLFTHQTFQRLTENHQTAQAEAFLQDTLNNDNPVVGEVALVGAGLVDAGLLTLKGLQTIQHADVVLYDALVSDSVMELVRRDADRVFVGKRVVRLKGGDPFVFGAAAKNWKC